MSLRCFVEIKTLFHSSVVNFILYITIVVSGGFWAHLLMPAAPVLFFFPCDLHKPFRLFLCFHPAGNNHNCCLHVKGTSTRHVHNFGHNFYTGGVSLPESEAGCGRMSLLLHLPEHGFHLLFLRRFFCTVPV